jgi:hypothetical protein
LTLRASFNRSLRESRSTRDGSDSLNRASAHRSSVGVLHGKDLATFRLRAAQEFDYH